MLKSTRKTVATGVAIAALGLGATLGSATAVFAASKPMTISVIYGPEKPQAKVWLRFKQLVDQRLPGQFNIKVVTNGALGGEKETTEGIRLGSIHGALSTLANLTSWVPEGAVFDMPFLFRNADHIKAVMNGPIGTDFKKKYEAKGFKVLGYIIYGARHVISKSPILVPADVKGKKMRVLQSQLHINLWKSLGANPTPVPITEAYNALKTGVVDYMDMTKSGYQALKLHEVVPPFKESDHILAFGPMYVSKRFWDDLTKQQQEVFQQTADQVTPFFNEMAAYEQGLALDAAVKKGAKVHRPDKAAWQKAMAGFWKSYASKVGGMAKIKAVVDTK